MRTVIKRFVWPDGEVALVRAHFRSNADEAPLELKGNIDRLTAFLGDRPSVGYAGTFESWWTQHDGRDGVRVFTEATGEMTHSVE